jgi:hypothetical protein
LPYTVEIVIKAETQTEAITTAEQAIKQLGTASMQTNQKIGQETQRAAQQANAAYQIHEHGAIRARTALLPLAAGISLVTANLQAHNPAVGAAVGAIDNFVIAAIAGGASTGGWAGALNVLKAILNPWTALVVAGGVALSYFVTQSRAATEKQEELNRAIQSGNFDVLKNKIQATSDELAKVERHFETVIALQAQLNAPQGSPLERAQQAGLDPLRRGLTEASRAAAQADIDLAEAKRKKALEVLPALQTRLELELKLAQASERQRPAIEAEALAQDLLAKGLEEVNIEKVREAASALASIKVREIDIAAGKAQIAVDKERAASLASGMQAILQTEHALRAQIIAVNQGKDAAEQYTIGVQAEALAVEHGADVGEAYRKTVTKLTADLVADTQKWAQRKLVLDAAAAAEENTAEKIEQTTEALTAHSRSLETDLDWQRKINDLDVEYLQILGRTDDAERLRIANTIKAAQARLELIKTGEILSEQTQREIQFLEKLVDVQSTALSRVGAKTIDVGRAVVDTLADMATGLATGTLKGLDVLKAAGSAGLRFFVDILRQTLAQKLSFEINLLGNLQGLPGQMQGALAGGAVSTGGGGGGIFGFLQNILGFGGGRPSGVEGPLMENGNFFSNILSFLDPKTLLGNPLALPFLGFGIGSMVNGIPGGIAGAIGSIFGGPIVSFVFSLISRLFSQPINPTVWVKSKLEGILYDELQNKFLPGDVISKGTGKDIDPGTVKAVANQVQTMLKAWSEQWADILNIFPVFAHDKMIPALDAANELLNKFFGNLKFSEGGSRTIQEELESLQKNFGPRGFFYSLRQVIGIGLNETFTRAGFDFQELIAKQWSLIVPGEGNMLWIEARKNPGLQPPHGGKDMEAFIEAVTSFASIASGLAMVSPRGVKQFLTEGDNALLDEQLRKVLSITDGKEFITAVEKLQEDLKPIFDFLEASVRQAAEAFATALGAAFQASSASDAKTAFIDSLKKSTAEALQAGMVQAFLATTEFNDLLAPLQQAIAQAMETATDTGVFDAAAFGDTLGPIIDALIQRFEDLGPIAEAAFAAIQPLLDALGIGGAGGMEESLEKQNEQLRLQISLLGKSAEEQHRIMREQKLADLRKLLGLPENIDEIIANLLPRELPPPPGIKPLDVPEIPGGFPGPTGDLAHPKPPDIPGMPGDHPGPVTEGLPGPLAITDQLREAIAEYIRLRDLLDEHDQLEIELNAQATFIGTTISLQRQLALIGQSSEEVRRLQREFYLADLLAQGLTQAQVDSIAALLDQVDAAQAAADAVARAQEAQEEAARAAEQSARAAQQAAEERNKTFKEDERNLIRQIALLGLSGEQAAALQRQFALDDMALEGFLGNQIDRIRELMETRDRTSFALDLMGGINDLSPEAAFPDFLRRLSGSVEEALAAGITNAFVAQQILPLLEGGPFGAIMERFGQIGHGLSAQEAFDLSRGDLDLLRGDLDSMRPIFEAMAELIRDLTGQLREGLGVRGEQRFEINIDRLASGDDSVDDLLRELGGKISGLLGPIQ